MVVDTDVRLWKRGLAWILFNRIQEAGGERWTPGDLQ